jgi:hypothetical protein
MSPKVHLYALRQRYGFPRHLAIFLILCLCFLSGCTTTATRLLESRSDGEDFERRCRPVEHVPGGTLFPSVSQLPQLSPSDAAKLSAATGFSSLTVEAAHAFDVLPLLIQMPALERALAEHREGAKEALQGVRLQIVVLRGSQWVFFCPPR